MTTRSSQCDSSAWRLDSNKATLCTPALTASIDLLKPSTGFSQLIFRDAPIDGFALGVNLDGGAALSKADITDAFVRGSDLVVTYNETNERPFSLQVYWRATIGEQGALLLDTILSFQTDLLESFPELTVETLLPAATARFLPDDQTKTTKLTLPAELPADRNGSLLLRATSGDWSYAETSHPEDRGECQIERRQDESLWLRRQLGGSFLEKGVIRSLRVRGVFLPSEGDLALATQCLASLATEEPPLTV